jgi:hypothetical protein
MCFGLDAFLSVCNNGKTRLLLFDYIYNESFTGLFHEKRMFLDWDARFLWLGPARKLPEKVTVGHGQARPTLWVSLDARLGLAARVQGFLAFFFHFDQLFLFSL